VVVGVTLHRKDTEDATAKVTLSACNPGPVVGGRFDSYNEEAVMPMKAAPKVVWMGPPRTTFQCDAALRCRQQQTSGKEMGESGFRRGR
jgi:hypothetical protein